MPMNTPILLVDSYAQIYRGFHAVRYLSTPDGVPTNAVFAMTKFLLKLHKEHPSQNGAFVFDKGKPAFRMELAPDYKANRPPMPDELKVQIPVIRDLVQAFGWSLIEHEGYEADDLIASLAKAFPENDVCIFSGDKDISQIIDSRVTMLVPNPAGDVAKRGVEEVREKFGIEPAQIADYLALVGDSADNIPGVEGVGPKTAASLLEQFGTAETMFARLDEVKRDTLRTKLAGAKERFQINLKLVRLDDVPPEGVVWKLDDVKRSEPDFSAIRKIAEKMSLKSILKEIDRIAGVPAEEDSLFAVFPEPDPQPRKPEENASDGMTQMDLF